MRIAFFGLAALTAVCAFHAAPVNALSYPVYPWCAEYAGLTGKVILVDGTGGGTNCYFATLWQCQQAVRGIGGACVRNPFYGYAGYPADQPTPSKYRHRNRL
jgi:uncharacterized protein DUF3551